MLGNKTLLPMLRHATFGAFRPNYYRILAAAAFQVPDVLG